MQQAILRKIIFPLKWAAFVSVLLLIPWHAHAQDGLKLESDQGTYRRDGLFLRVLLADEPKASLKELMQPPDPKNIVFRTRTVFRRGDIVLPAILYYTDALDQNGVADVSYDFYFYNPDGSLYDKMEDRTVVLGKPPKGVGIYRDMAGLKIEETDPFGEYKLDVKIHDRNRKVTVEMPFTFTVTSGVEAPVTLLDKEKEATRAGGRLRTSSDDASPPAPSGRIRKAADTPQ